MTRGCIEVPCPPNFGKGDGNGSATGWDETRICGAVRCSSCASLFFPTGARTYSWNEYSLFPEI